MLIIGSILTIFLGVLPVRTTYVKGKELLTASQEMSQALKNQDLEQAKEKLPQVKQKLLVLR